MGDAHVIAVSVGGLEIVIGQTSQDDGANMGGERLLYAWGVRTV
jgi:hypothetical protein